MSRLIELATGHSRALVRLRACCARIDRLATQGNLSVTDFELVYESAFVNASSRFEGLLGALLHEFVCGDTSQRSGCYRLLIPKSRTAFRAILHGGRPYVDLMPYERLLDIARRFLNDGKPFTDVDAADIQLLSQATAIRNAIAHRSKSSLEKFRGNVPGVQMLAAARRFPGPYLRYVYRTNPQQSYGDLYLQTLEKVGLKLANSW